MFEQYITNSYLRAFIVFFIVFLAARILLMVIRKIFMKITSKTKTDLDDKLIQKSSIPFTIIAFLISLRVTLLEISLAESVNLVLNKLIYSTLIIVFAYLIYVIVKLIIINGLKKVAKRTKSEIDDSLISLIQSILSAAIFIISILYLLSVWGIEIGPLLAGLGIAGLAVALALQPVLSNIFSGAAMILDHSVRVGDLIYLDSQTKGKIQKIGLRSTKIITFDNELIIIPNNKLADNMIQNIAMPEPKSRVVIPFSVAYGTNIEKVKKVILAEIKKIKDAEKNPEPIVRFIEMAESSLNFKAYFYVDSFEKRFAAIDEANTRIYDVLNKNKIEIPFPQRDIHIKK